MSDETKPSPGPWRVFGDHCEGIMDAKEDGIVWDECGIRPADAALLAGAWQLREDNREMLELLRKHEWSGHEGYGRDGDGPACPECRTPVECEHCAGCKWGAVLAKHKDKP